ncbi:Nitroreductase family protein [Candidatus Syntrophocurvum alkaliphilum]|uniref:Nitroreductase family protein n=1 Tax=Candidatus Syntrophocurvum alkaliphilum TaxID=2293317 RepID=A0A6I6DDA8_9FIRM|nr:nitroreductase family protein [Candidatus Syntrophocurvum alkaliphilum]QGT99286.1 Nitroreductase family protein [Candidatus Syntrophocurvum alkaliphilum]
MNSLNIDNIKNRTSVRTFINKEIETNKLELIQEYIDINENKTGLFGNETKFKIVKGNINPNKKEKIGTYGFIKGTQTFIVGIMKKDKENNHLDYGYSFEKLILFLTGLDIGTCWLGASFNRNKITKLVELQEDEIIPCITPIGYAENKMRFMEKAIRLTAKSDHRKDWSELFFNTNLLPLTKNQAEKLEIPLEMIRLGPSASNKQPWRIIIDNEKVHFYLKRTPNYGKYLAYDIQMIDIGIACCHFQISSEELGLKGEWTIKNPRLNTEDKDTIYVCTWIRE